MDEFIAKYLPVIIVIAFNAGGVLYLARNHFAHLRKDIDEIIVRLRKVENRVSYIEGSSDSAK